MAREHAGALCLESIPDVAVVVVVAGKEETARDREGDRGDTAEDVVVRVLVELAVGAQVKETARGIVRTSAKGVAVREEPVEHNE